MSLGLCAELILQGVRAPQRGGQPGQALFDSPTSPATLRAHLSTLPFSRLYARAANACCNALGFLVLSLIYWPIQFFFFQYVFLFLAVSLLETMVQLKSLYWLIKYLASFLAKEQEGNLHLNKIWMSAEDS